MATVKDIVVQIPNSEVTVRISVDVPENGAVAQSTNIRNKRKMYYHKKIHQETVDDRESIYEAVRQCWKAKISKAELASYWLKVR